MLGTCQSFARGLAVDVMRKRRCCVTCPYKVLGLDGSASRTEIRARYLELARKHHPDVQPPETNGTSRVFEQVNEAYQKLSDRKSHAELDSSIATVRDLMRRGCLSEAIEIFQALESSIIQDPKHARLASALFVACTGRGSIARDVSHPRTAALWQWMLQRGLVDAMACNAWFDACMRSGRHSEAMAAYRYAEQHSLQQSRHMQITIRQIRRFKDAQAAKFST